MKKTPLSEKMRARANGMSDGQRLIEAADALDKASTPDENGNLDVKKMLGAWAKARKIWCEFTGESLI